MTKRLFIDMDGTIARFYAHSKYEEAMFEPGFFKNLKPYRKVILGLKMFAKKHPDVPLFILSACITDYSVTEKDEWATDHFNIVTPERRIYMRVGEKKADFVPGGISNKDYLLDDYTKNVVEWTTAGGKGIKIQNEINCKNGVWKGDKISSYDTPSQFCENLEKILGV